MKKTYKLCELGCAVCAAKMEDAIRKIDGVQYISINFISQKMTLEVEDSIFDEVMKKVAKAVKRIEPDCSIEI